MALAPLLISLVAIGISLAALWKTHLSPFSALSVVGRLKFHIYPIRSGNKRWFIASLDVPISVTNEGARPGVIDGLRLRLHFPEIPIRGNCEFVRPAFEIDAAEAKEIDKNRFEWIGKIVVGDWMPFTVLPKTTVTKHFVFESRWEDPVIQDIVDCTLEIMSGKDKWQKVVSWSLVLDGRMWSALVDSGTGISYHSDSHKVGRGLPECVPADLHKYTGSKTQLPKDGLRLETSRLDYPETETHGTEEV